MQHSSFRRVSLTLPVVLLVWLLTSLFADEEPPVDPAIGFYPLISIQGNGTRTVDLNLKIDSVPLFYPHTITLKETRKGTKAGKLVLLNDGTVTGEWDHTLDGEQTPNTPFSFSLDFSTKVTGTWSSNGSGKVTLTLDALVSVEGSMDFGFEVQNLNFTDLPFSFPVEATLTSGGGLEVPIDATKTSLLAMLVNFDGTPESVIGAMETLGYTITPTGKYEYNSVDPGPEVESSVSDFGEWKWTGASTKGTMFKFGPTEGNLNATYKQYYLRDVPAPFGFYVQGDWGTAMGTQNVNFRYGTDQVLKSVETGYAEALNLDYKTSDTFIEADIKEGSTILETLHLDLIKVPVTAWAGTAGDFTAKRGVIYEATSHWPLSMVATRSLSDASVLDGLWGLVGSATSTFEIKAHSNGSGQSGKLDTKLKFRLGLKVEEFSLTGEHTTTLNESGLSTTGTFNTAPVSASISASAGLTSLVPGANAALSAIGFSGGGIGAKVTGSLSGSIGGGYAAETSDSEIKFTSGALTATATIHAQVNATPKFLHGILKLQIGGGGGATITIQVAPTPSVTSLTGYLNFTLVAKVFGQGPEIDKTWNFGDPPPAPLSFYGMTAFAPHAPLALSGAAPANAIIPAQAQAMVRNTTVGNALIAYAAPHPTLPAPASDIVITRISGGDFNPIRTERMPDSGGLAHFAPSLSHVPNATDPQSVVVWSQGTGTNPADMAGIPAFMNSTELRFAYVFATLGQMEEARVLTTNGVADFGPSVIRTTGADLARLFWVRGSGSDFYGSTTALTILNRDWTGGYNPAAPVVDPSTIWSPEVTAVSDLTHIMDWRATAWDANNAAIAIIRDMDADLDTVDDTELWIARQTAGVWAAPVRVTTNAVADQAPALMFKNATTLVIGWRQGDMVVGTKNFDTTPPAVWFDAASEVAENWDDAQIRHRVTPDSIALFFRQDDGIAYTDEQFGDIVPGSAWPERRFVPLGGGAVSAFDATFTEFTYSDDTEALVTAVVENSTGATPTTAPTTLNASPTRVVLNFGGPESYLSFIEDIENADLAVGDPFKLCARAQGPGPFTYQWYRNGVAITGATSYMLDLGTATADESGEYRVVVKNGSQILRSKVASIKVGSDLFADWIAMHGYTGPDADPTTDPDGDGAENRLEYLFNTSPRDSADRPVTEVRTGGYDFVPILFSINRRATGVTYVLEQTSDLVTWHDVTYDIRQLAITADSYMLRLIFPKNAASTVWFPFPIEDRNFFRIRITSGP